MNDLNISTDWTAYVESQVEAGVISEADAQVLLTEGTLDITDPATQAYLEMAYLQFVAYIDPVSWQAGYAEIQQKLGSEATTHDYYMAVREREGDDFNIEFDAYAEDHIGVLATGAAVDSDDETDPQAIIDAINAYEASQSGIPGYDYVNEEAYAMLDTIELDNEAAFRDLISNDDFHANVEMFFDDQIFSAMEQFKYISEAIASGEVTPEVGQAQIAMNTATIQFWTGLKQSDLSVRHLALEMFSNLLKAEGESRQQLNANVKSPAA